MASPGSKKSRVAVLVTLMVLNGVLGALGLWCSSCGDACTLTAASLGEGSMSCTAEKHYGIVKVCLYESQLHQDVVRVFRATQYKAFAALLKNMTESVDREEITGFVPSEHGILSEMRVEYVVGSRVGFHIIEVIIPFSRLEASGSTLTMDMSNFKVLVRNATAGAFEADDAMMVDPGQYTEAAIARHGINSLFLREVEAEAMANKGCLPSKDICAFLCPPAEVKNVWDGIERHFYALGLPFHLSSLQIVYGLKMVMVGVVPKEFSRIQSNVLSRLPSSL